MARAALTVQNTSRTGLNASYAAATADGHAFNNALEKVVLHVKNGGASPVTVTIDTVVASLDGLTVPDLTVTIPAGEDRFIGPFPNTLYGQANVALGIDQAVHVNAAPQASVTYAAIKMGSTSY